MADILASFYGPSISKEQIEEEIKKPDLMKTRRLHSSKGVLIYASLTRYDIPKCIFFQSILQSKYPSMTNNNEMLGNFVCNMFLPLPMAGAVVFSSRKRLTENRVLTGFQAPIISIEEKTVGSSSEGLFLPEIHTMDGRSFKIDDPDEDKIYIFSNLRIGTDRRSTQAFAFLETSPDSPPLFVRLKYNRQFRMRDEKNCFDLSKTITADGYIHRVQLTRSLRMILKDYARNYKREYNVFKNKDGILPDVKFSQHLLQNDFFRSF